MNRFTPGHILLLVALCIQPTLRSEDKPDPALPALENARKAFNEGKSDAAVNAFREFIKQFAQHKEVPAANYGLGLALLELPQKDYNAAIAALQQAAGKNDFAERASALYCLAIAQRAVGLAAADQLAAKPGDAGLKKIAGDNFAEALKNFTAAGDAFAEKLKAKADSAADQDGFLRARADQADALLRLEKPKDAADLAANVLKDKAFEKNPLREGLLYAAGCAHFALKDHFAAGRALSQLAPFQQDFGMHARYLLSRIHHLAGERPEAQSGYKAVLSDFEQRRKVASDSMKNPAVLKPDDRLRYEALLKSVPEHIARAIFYNSLLAAEGGEFGEAIAGLVPFTTQFATSPLIEEARLRLGYCYSQVKNAAETAKLLTPLHGHAKFGDQAMWWTAKAQLSAGDPNNAQTFAPIAKGAIELLKKASDKAGELGKTDAEAKTRRGQILLDLADAQLLAHLEKDGAATYAKIVEESANTDLAEMAMERQTTALHLAAQYKESDEACQKFEKTFPKSTLLQAVWFRSAENASLSAIAASTSNDPSSKEPRAEVDKKFDEAISRYQKLISKYPEFQYINTARFGLGTAQYQRGKYEDAAATLSAILEADRNGELGSVNYLQADTLIRMFPADTDNALQAAAMIDKAESASRLLEKYAGAQGKTPQGADALLKLGHCYQRVGMLMADPAERTKILTQARQMYEKIMNEMNNTPSFPAAVMERARCLALLGDTGGAMNEFNRFNADPLQKSSVAPLAVLRLATLMRSQNRAQETINMLAQARTKYESTLQKDSSRSEWVALIQIEHALALKDFNKHAEARPILEAVVKQFDKRPEGLTALWRLAQVRREEIQIAIAKAKETSLKQGIKPEELAAANKAAEEGIAALRQTAESLKSEAAKLAAPASGQPKIAGATDLAQRMYYESAWCYRVLADEELNAARKKLSAKAEEKVAEEYKNAKQPPPSFVPPDVAVKDLPEQPSEKAAQEQYTALVALDPSAPLAIRGRVELAEMQLQRGQNDAALEHLSTALEDNPPRDLAERIRVRIGACLLAKDDAKAALAQAQFVVKNQQSTQMADALLLMGEAQAQLKDWNQAINQFVVFRDRDPFRNMGALTERGMFRLGQSFAEAKRWDESRQALEQVVGRFPQSPLVAEARMGMGWAFQNMNQHDNACNNYAEVTRRTAGEVAARAQLNFGLCRLAQKRFPEAAKELQKAALYDNAEISAQALCEAGQAMLEDKKPDEAKKLWQTVIKDYAASKAAETAKQKLAAVK
jgi:TolA-binding protein